MECLHCKQYFKPLGIDEKFCCKGCDIVYHAFIANGLADFYKYKTKGAKSVAESDFSNDYGYLDHPDLTQKLLRDDKLEVSFYVENVHCLACIWFFERLASLNSNILNSDIQFNLNILKLTLKRGTKLSSIAQLIQRFGYKVHLISNNNLDHLKMKTRQADINRIVIAFFCLGNIMLLSVSIYSGANGFFEKYFNLICGILSLPVIIYSCRPFFKNFISGIKTKTFSIDIPISLALIIGFFASYIGIFINPEMVYFDSLAMLVFLLLASRFILDQVKLSVEEKLSNNNFFSQIIAKKIDDNQVKQIMARFVAKNDRLLVSPRSTVASDGKIVKGASFFDTSLINGESKPIQLKAGDTVSSGMINLNSEVEMIANCDYRDSLLGRMESDLSQNNGTKNYYSKAALYSSKFFFYLAIILSGLVLLNIRPWDLAFERLIAIIVITCPCALGLVVPLTMIIGLKELNRKGIYVKNESSILGVKHLENIFFDKTGTLTYTEFDFKIEFTSRKESESLNALSNIESLSSHPIALGFCKNFPIKDKLVLKNFSESDGVLQAQIDNVSYMIEPVRDSHNTCFRFLKDNNELLRVHVEMQFREDAPRLIEYFRIKNKNLYLLSGDNEEKVKEAAKYFQIENFYSGQTPISKKKVLELKSNTLMVGDGVNDTLSMQTADISIAVNTSVDFAQNCADIYLAQDNLSLVSTFIESSLMIERVLRRSIIMSSILNLIYIYFAWIGYISPFMAAIIMPATSLILLVHSLVFLREIDKAKKSIKTDNNHTFRSRLKLN